jgi:hypothetical protein
MKIGTNLSRKEILDLQNADFQLPQHTIISPRRLFGMEELPFDLSSYPTLQMIIQRLGQIKTSRGTRMHPQQNKPTIAHPL